jgi:hypothetical protein
MSVPSGLTLMALDEDVISFVSMGAAHAIACCK